jgi:hypothetical protein
MRFRLWWLALVLLAVPAAAQVVFPLTLKVQWDPNPAAENVTAYLVTIDSTATTVAPGVCTVSLCEQSFQISTPGPHTVTVVATNLFGSGPASSVVFTAVSPGKSANVKITK